MSENAGTKEETYVRAIELACSSDNLRRELLWLRAMEKQDEEQARDLESVDPELVSRLAEVVARAEGLNPRAARELFGRAQDERMETVLAIVEREAIQRK